MERERTDADYDGMARVLIALDNITKMQEMVDGVPGIGATEEQIAFYLEHTWGEEDEARVDSIIESFKERQGE